MSAAPRAQRLRDPALQALGTTFLLLVWLVVISLLMGWASDLFELCGRMFA